MKSSLGFTLIELLVVVAIIGVLASIAVPNFLNAQMKVRITRCKADLHALGTAMEQYFIENRNYPPGLQIHRLTSPVAFISSIPRDIFAPKFEKTSLQTEEAVRWTWYRYVPTTVSEQGRYGSSACADYYAYYPPYALRYEAKQLSLEKGCPIIWLIKSFGPNTNQLSLCGANHDNGDDCTFRYDPSNGLISIGDIAIFGPGNRI